MDIELVNVRREGSFVSFTREEEGKKIVVPCRDVRGSFVLPTPTSPSYFCIFAQRSEPSAQGKFSLILLSEDQEALPQKFFQKMIEHSRRLWCREFYTDLQKENRELMALFGDMCRYGRTTHIHLSRAPLSQNFNFGIGLVRQWAQDGALEIPEGSILRAQLSAMSLDDLT